MTMAFLAEMDGAARLGWLLAALLGAGLVVALGRLVKLRAKHEFKATFGSWPVPTVDPGAFDEAFRIGPLGATRDAEVLYISSVGTPAGTGDREAWVLAVLAKRSRSIFEFGTATGKTTYLLAANAPADAAVHTLTLSPEEIAAYRRDGGDAGHDTRAALGASRFSRFYYQGTPVDGKVRQYFGDSKTFDHGALKGRCDLIFVDGSHARSYVESDSEKALEMLAPGGVIVWHDYRGPYRPLGVYQGLNALVGRLGAGPGGLVHISGTSLVAYRKAR